jgi:NAD(P)-dependent dehydrogenase (short-subunit alcohol dehydrogenase family)
MCEAFAAHGADVVVASRKEEACRAVADELARDHGIRAVGIATHVGHWDQCDRLLAETLEKMGGIDILINNAGMSPPYGAETDVSEALFDKVVAVNLKGPFRLAALAGEHMAAAGGGSIINVTSISAVQPRPGELPYAAAKAGLNALTHGLARAYAPSVRVNAIMAGAFMTDISKAWDADEFARTARERIALGRGGQPDEVVGAALYLASGASSYTTGAVLKVDGGWAYGGA